MVHTLCRKNFGEGGLPRWLMVLLLMCSPLANATTSSLPERHKQNASWENVLNEARGETVYFNAWGGDTRINNYIRWAGDQIGQRYGVKLQLVKVDDISSVVSRILAEKGAGRVRNGSVDLLWINGENFRSMKNAELLYGPFTTQLPAMANVDSKEKPTTAVDFGEPVDGMEAPWGMAQLVFMYDGARIKAPPASAEELLQFAKQHQGRVTYPSPPDFVGVTFLKQLLFELVNDKEILQKPVNEKAFQILTMPLWKYLDQLHPLLWRKGKSFPSNNLALTPLLDDGDIILSMTFNPAYASAAINNGELSDTVRTYVHKGGTLGNTHFLAIPFNSSAAAGARVVINFLLSPEAQARKADPVVWGDPTVLSMSRLSDADQRRFAQQGSGLATLSPEQLGKAIPEPHASWVTAIEKAWQQRYR